MADSPHYAHFDGMAWPLPSERIGDIEYKMRYESDTLTRGDLLLAASVLSSYRELIHCSEKKRRAVVAGIRKTQKDLDNPPLPVRQ